MLVAGEIGTDAVPSCDALYEAQKVIQDLITEHCPIAQPMRPATKKKVSVKK